MNLYTAIVAVVAICAVVQISRHWFAGRHAADEERQTRNHDADLQRLEERIRTLERIVTDNRDTLRHKFDDLE